MVSNCTTTFFHGGSVRTVNAANVDTNNALPRHTQNAFSGQTTNYGVQKSYNRGRQQYYFDAGYTNHGQHIGTNNSGTAGNFGANQTDDQDCSDQENLKGTPEAPHWKGNAPLRTDRYPWEHCVHSDRSFYRSTDTSQQGHTFGMSPALQEYIGHLQELAHNNNKPTNDDDEVMSECGIQESENLDTAMDEDDEDENGSHGGGLASDGESMPFTPVFQDNRKYMTTNIHQQVLIFGHRMI